MKGLHGARIAGLDPAGAPIVELIDRYPPFAIKQTRNTPTSQDAMTALGLWNAGYARLTTIVPRARYIGIQGLSFTPKVYRKQGFDKQQNFEFTEEDKSLEKFTLYLEDSNGKLIKPTMYE